jgi:phosphate-selective porin
MKKNCSLAVLTLALASVTALAAQSSVSVEDRLARLEASLARIEQHLDQSVTADELAPTLKEFADLERSLGYDGKTPINVVKVGGAESKLALGGYVQAHYESGTAPDARWAGVSDRFFLRRARINATGAFAEFFSFKLESDFGNNSLGPKTGLAGQLTDAFIAWTKYPAASVKVGQFKSPFGYEQLLPDTKILTVERSNANDKLTQGRQIGAQLGGDLANKRVSYAVAAFNGTGTNIGSNDSQKFMWVARTSAVAFEGKASDQKIKLTTGLNYFTTVDKGTFTGHRYGTGLDTQVIVGPAEFQAEWLRNDQHPTVGKTTAAAGWSLLGALAFTKQWQGIARYETYDSNTAVGNTTTNAWTFGLNYLLHGDDLKLSLDYVTGRPPVPTPHGDRLLGRVQVVF